MGLTEKKIKIKLLITIIIMRTIKNILYYIIFFVEIREIDGK